MRLRYFMGLALTALALATSAHAQTNYVATMNGAQENPPVPSPAVGNGTATLNAAQTSFTFTVNYTGLLGTVAANHIHRGAVGVNGPVIFPINQNIGSTSGTLTGTWAIPAAEVVNLNNGLLYFNIHTAPTYGGGEIRGQILLGATPNNPQTWGRIKSLYR